MKKSNLITVLSFVILIIAVILFMFFWKTNSENPDEGAIGKTTQRNTVSVTSKSSDTKLSEKETDLAKTTTVSMDDALFIGDSRTVGLSEYSCIEGADFFANVGMSVYNINKEPVSVPTVGKVTLTELLNNKRYGKIYIMLGINEVGYKIETTVDKYSELIEFIREKQPDAVIIIQSNLHVTKSRSDSDKVVNNKSINVLNKALSELADGKAVFYLDANAMFDDENGNLSSEKSEDDVHPYAKYYTQWGKWIVQQTVLLFGEG